MHLRDDALWMHIKNIFFKIHVIHYFPLSQHCCFVLKHFCDTGASGNGVMCKQWILANFVSPMYHMFNAIQIVVDRRHYKYSQPNWVGVLISPKCTQNLHCFVCKNCQKFHRCLKCFFRIYIEEVEMACTVLSLQIIKWKNSLSVHIWPISFIVWKTLEKNIVIFTFNFV